MNEVMTWIRQARADFDCASCLKQKAQMGCHMTAKTQQCVEKAIKSLLLAQGIQFAHDHAPFRYFQILLRNCHSKRMPQGSEKQMIGGRISRLFGETTRITVLNLEKLAPTRTDITKRNTEYPYKPNGGWVAPCDEGVFKEEEKDSFFDTARDILVNIERIIDMIRRQKAVRNRP
ncbi:MAG: HEPN domain-containing protein [Candidatus Sumerlaeota bacterium]|nr:HEPN domain-containing protein [Candidatus Sumerlaeota bacterium]